MRSRAVVVVAVVGALAYWGWNQFHAHGPVPTDDVVTRLAEDQWGSNFCYDLDTRWPCIIPTDISLDGSAVDYEARDGGMPYRRCFNIYFQVESTAWNYSNGGPSEPRTYMAAPKPLRACADVTYFTGAPDSVDSWSFVPTDDPPWYRDTLDALHSLLCANPPAYAAYNCR